MVAPVFYVERYAKVLKKSNMRKSEIFNTVLDVVAAETLVKSQASSKTSKS